MLLPQTFERRNVFIQLLLGIVFGSLEKCTSVFFWDFLKAPLFMDCIWTAGGSFYGLWCGVSSSIVFHGINVACLFFKKQVFPLEIIFLICSFSVVAIIRFFCRKEVNFQNLVKSIVVSTIVISIEGAIIVNVLYEISSFSSMSVVDSFENEYGNKFVSLISSMGIRLFVNLLDKTIAVESGFFIAYGIKILEEKFSPRYIYRQKNPDA